MFEKGLAGNVMAAMLIALLLIGCGLIAQAVWPQLLSAGQFQYADQSTLADEVRLREIQLQRQSQQLIEPFVAGADFRVIVNINDVRPGARQVTLLINRPEADSALAQSLREILWSGLALNAARGDKIVAQFHAFASTGSEGASGLRTGDKIFSWRVVVGVVAVSFVLMVVWFSRRRRSRELLKAQETDGYQEQLLALKVIAKQEPGRVAGVLSAWLNDERQ